MALGEQVADAALAAGDVASHSENESHALAFCYT
jgi:hypothetical protein